MANCAIHWFRKGLRLHDNPALSSALTNVCSNNLELRPIFILDPIIARKLRVGPNRWRFLVQSLEDLDDSLKKIGSRLFVIRGTPEEVFKRILKEWNVKLITFESDIEPYSEKRDEIVRNIAKEHGVKVVENVGHTLLNPLLVAKKNGGSAPLTYQKFISVFESMTEPTKPIPAPVKLDASQRLSNGIYRSSDHSVPTLEELGVSSPLGECLFPGGETEAVRRMEESLKNTSWVCKFEKPNTAPNSLAPSTTVLSPYLKFGCLSPRTFYYKLKDIIHGKAHSKPPVSLIGQLLWREFYYVVASDTPNFDKMVGNKICCQVAWSENQAHLDAWTHGKTGYPFIDAIMRQLRQEGWIHHLARHAVACFLTRGDLWISWEEGQKVFEELLLDADWALNAGNWMWLSASAFFHQFFRVYSPVAFGKKTDKFGDYIKKYVPELKNIPSQYIYEPWNAPLSVQQRAGCLIGQDYPRRIVIHEEVYKINISKMSAAYKENKKENIKRPSSTFAAGAAKKMRKQ